MKTYFEFAYSPRGSCRYEPTVPRWGRWLLIVAVAVLVLQIVGLVTPSVRPRTSPEPAWRPLPIASGGDGQRAASTSATPVGWERK